ncbi:hypothetical protein H351_32385 (plasmid) [Rhodococcus erythropolis R138]|uniref:hypothetical protein n=1 Tax=Rhodococcus erythropolis TaxID=1833 RepID=UPI0004A87696|nr:hypothetical protein [Rhodococcus erythropolis]ALU73765.1 hypothetical protein H351_32385 [Rhodococcus erythropolis R138]
MTALVIAGFVGGIFGGITVRDGWNTEVFGPISAWVAASATLLAVVVALTSSRKSLRIAQQSVLTADRSVETAETRAIREREFNHRRDNTKAIVDMWAQIGSIRPALERSRQGARRGDQAELRTSDSFLRDRIAAASGAVFYAKTVTLEAEVRSAIEDMSKQFDDFETSWSDGPGCGPDDTYELTKWFDEVIAKYEAAEAHRQESSDLLRLRLPLIDSAEAEIARMLQQQSPATQARLKTLLETILTGQADTLTSKQGTAPTGTENAPSILDYFLIRR